MRREKEDSIWWARVKNWMLKSLSVTSSFFKYLLKLDNPDTVLVPLGNMTRRRKSLLLK